MKKNIVILMFVICPFFAKAADPQMLLEETISMVGTGKERTWNNKEIGRKLREIRQNYAQTSQALDATALLAFYLSQVPGDNSKETTSLCREVSLKAPDSWQAWLANCAEIASYGLRENENQKTLTIALDALAKTNGDELCKDPNSIRLLKPLMDQWPPVSTDFTDNINSVIVQQAFVLGQYKLGEKHILKIVNPRMRAFGESCMADYLREHPEIPTDQLRDKKGSSRLRNDNSASEDTLDSIKQRHKLTSADSEKSLRQGSNKFILWVIGSAVLLVVALVWMLLQSSTRRK